MNIWQKYVQILSENSSYVQKDIENEHNILILSKNGHIFAMRPKNKKNEHMIAFDRNKPFNELPLLPPCFRHFSTSAILIYRY